MRTEPGTLFGLRERIVEMANYSGSFSVLASTTVELFTKIGITAGHYAVALHTDAGSPPLVLVNDSSGEGVSFALPDAEGELFRFNTDKDPVYIGNISGSSINLYYYLSAPA